MATITIRNLSEETKRGLRIRAAEKGVSMEEEARQTLDLGNAKLSKPSIKKGGWVDEARALFRDFGDVELELPPRQPLEPPIDFSGPEFDR